MSEELTSAAAVRLAAIDDWRDLAALAAPLRDVHWGKQITYSRKVFAPLTHLCRDVCHYCTFAAPPKRGEPVFLSVESVLRLAREGAAAGCKEILFTLGDKPELRYRAAREALAELGHETTLSYLGEVARRVIEETGLLPHLNPGLMTVADLRALRPIAASMGIMLESTSDRLCERDGPHFGSPDKNPTARLATIAAAGEAQVPLTTGLLIGIGETRLERVDTLLAIRDAHRAHSHIQEVIVQNFRAKPGTKMADASDAPHAELCWTIAAARLILGGAMSIQAPPNLSAGNLSDLVAAGLNDWGGVSPITPDHVNPEAPWPHIDALAEDTQRAGFTLVERLTIYPRFVKDPERWLDKNMRRAVLRHSDSGGLARVGTWSPGGACLAGRDDHSDIPFAPAPSIGRRTEATQITEKAVHGDILSAVEIEKLFHARGDDFRHVVSAANDLRLALVGDTVTYVVTRNINYTNICAYHCGFCAFSKGKTHDHLRGKAYIIDSAEIALRVRDAWRRGATEVCMQGGIHPSFDGNTYFEVLAAAKKAQPKIHVHAFSPLEVNHGAGTLGISVAEFLAELKVRGLGSLPGTAAEILHDDVRRIICPDKVNTDEWLAIIGEAHRQGLRTTATIMFGHVDHYGHWAAHLARVLALQLETGGFTEFVPLPFVHMEAPIYLKGMARKGPTLREAILMHAVARLTFGAHIPNIQASWPKLGPSWAARCLDAGVNDLGGTLMDESISRAAGASHGQEFDPQAMECLIAEASRVPRQRTTLYATAQRRQMVA